MPKRPEGEIWSLAYGIAMTALTLRVEQPDQWSPERLAEILDERARAIADRSLETLKAKKVI